MRRNWLAGAAVAVALSVPMAGVAEAAQAAPLSSSQHTAAATRVLKSQPARHRRTESFDMKVANYVKRFIGAPYVYGGTSRQGLTAPDSLSTSTVTSANASSAPRKSSSSSSGASASPAPGEVTWCSSTCRATPTATCTT